MLKEVKTKLEKFGPYCSNPRDMMVGKWSVGYTEFHTDV